MTSPVSSPRAGRTASSFPTPRCRGRRVRTDGGRAGPVRQAAVRALDHRARQAQGERVGRKLPIIGVGGVTTGEDAYLKIAAGADPGAGLHRLHLRRRQRGERHCRRPRRRSHRTASVRWRCWSATTAGPGPAGRFRPRSCRARRRRRAVPRRWWRTPTASRCRPPCWPPPRRWPPLDDRRGAVGHDEVGGHLVERLAAALHLAGEHVGEALGQRRTGQHRIDRDAGAGQALGEAAGDRHQRRLAEAVVDHVGGDIEGRLRRHEHHAAPAALGHAAGPGARQADAGEDVDLEIAAPFLIGRIEEVARAEDTEVVDEDVAIGLGFGQRRAAFGGAEVAGVADETAAGYRRASAGRRRCTASSLRPLITTAAPLAASPLAMARPMPAVEPVTTASLPVRSIFMACLLAR